MWEDLIDTLWNVKFFFSKTNRKLPPDLIDTLWNVKAVRARPFIHLAFDLIDTLWNVKYSLLPSICRILWI